ncbi:MAG: T9SS type A sorting domain-containing protein [Crocinitomix sp.]|nr:T9SS type A sorting domain-containing protein [Crocinitomix sp.]
MNSKQYTMKQFTFLLFALIIGVTVSAQDFAWAADYSGDQSYVTALTVDNDGSSYSAVVCIGTIDFDPGPANYEVFGGPEGKTVLQKLDVDGNFIWAKEFLEPGAGDGVIGNGLEVNGITVDDSGNLLLTGSTSGRIDYDPGDEEFFADEVGVVYYDIFILKLTNNGDFLWAQTMGSGCNDGGEDIDIDHNGSVYVTGTFCLTVDFNDGVGTDELAAAGVEGSDVFILKLTEDGEFVWVKSIESDFFDEVLDLEIDKNNNVYIGGYYTNSADFDPSLSEHILDGEGTKKAFLLKLNEEGAYDWVITIPGPSYGKITGIELDSDGNIYAVGDFFGEDIDFDPGVDVSPLTSAGLDDIFVTKYTNSGELIWAKQLGGVGYDRSALIEISAINTIYITGNYKGNIDVDPSGSEFILEYSEDDDTDFDMFLCTLNEDGDFIQALSFNGESNEECVDLIRGTEGSIYLAGSTTSELDINPSVDEFLLFGENYDPTGYVLKLQDGHLGIEKNVEVVKTNLYPNPTQGTFNIQMDKRYDNLQVVIQDQTGRIIQQQLVEDMENVQLTIDGPNGIYFVKISSAEIDIVLKVSKTN